MFKTEATAGFLLDQVPGVHSDGQCWSRRYSDDHLARHPLQKVTELRLLLRYDPKLDQHVFDIDIATRERAGAVFGTCSGAKGAAAICSLACDGGEFHLRAGRASGSIMLDIEPTGQLQVNARCNVDAEGAASFLIDALPDDRVFLLHEVPVKTCTVQPFKPYLDRN